MPLQMQKTVITFYEKDSQKAIVTKLNEFVMAVEKRVSALESKAEDVEERVIKIELNF